MTAMALGGHLGAQVSIDVCATCQAFWFDQFESLQLSAGSTLNLMKFIGEHSSPRKASLPDALPCPRCATRLRLAHDMQRNMPFTYWRCGNEHGRFIGFFEFLKEKNFIHPLSSEQIKELRQNVQFVNCSNCGASINLESTSVCSYCHSPISMLDMKQPQQMLEQLKRAAEPRPIDPALPLKLASAKLETETSLAGFDRSPEWWSDAHSWLIDGYERPELGECKRAADKPPASLMTRLKAASLPKGGSGLVCRSPARNVLSASIGYDSSAEEAICPKLRWHSDHSR